jgi:hypothetical protein
MEAWLEAAFRPRTPGADHHLFISPYFKIEPLLDEQVSVCKNTCGGETA